LLLLLLLLAALEEVLPCTGYVEVGCVANLVRGGCDPAAAAAIVAALGLAVVRAMAELVAYTALLLSPPVPAWDASTIGKRAAAARAAQQGEAVGSEATTARAAAARTIERGEIVGSVATTTRAIKRGEVVGSAATTTRATAARVARQS
jgi:hypothetical protein